MQWCCLMLEFAMPITVNTLHWSNISAFGIYDTVPHSASYNPHNTLNLNDGTSYLDNLYLLVPLPLSESKGQKQVSLTSFQSAFQNVTATRADTCP